MSKKCPTCGKQMNHKSGTSKKSGKPYAGWFCSDYDCEQDPIWGAKGDTQAQSSGGQMTPKGSVSAFRAFGETLKEVKKNQKRIMRGIAKVLDNQESSDLPTEGVKDRKFSAEEEDNPL